jgi:glycosyltransferase involved in cell wall biosynthesis
MKEAVASGSQPGIQVQTTLPALHARISVIIPVLNARQYLESCLDSVLAAAARHGNVEIVVVDNGSTDGSYELLQSRYATRTKVLQRKSANIGALRNYGARHAAAELLSFIDADCRVDEQFFLELMKVFQNIECDATGSSYQLPEACHWIEKTWYESHSRAADGYVGYINGCNLAVIREAFENVGGFDETMVTGEDKQLAHKLWAAGHKVFESHAVAAVHLGNPKSMSEFLRQQIWHGLGELRMGREKRLCKPLLMTLAHVTFIAAGIMAFIFLPAPWSLRSALLVACLTAVPISATAYRSWQRRRVYRPIAVILLYFLYFTGRSYSLLLTQSTRFRLSQNEGWRRR